MNRGVSTLWIVSLSKWWIQHSSYVCKYSRKQAKSTPNNIRFFHYVINLMLFWPGVTHQEETLFMPSSLYRIFSTLSQDMIIVLAIWFIVSRLLYTTMWWTQCFSWWYQLQKVQTLSSSNLSQPTYVLLIKLEYRPLM